MLWDRGPAAINQFACDVYPGALVASTPIEHQFLVSLGGVCSLVSDFASGTESGFASLQV